jgi:DNA-binding transcriptional LysR family regulator
MTALPDFDPILLRSFVAVVQARSFSEAARRLGLRQSTVSQQIQRLEAQAGRRLLARDTHGVSLTGDGDAMLEFAGWILEAQDQARRHFGVSELGGALRVGAAEDFALSRLPAILRDFTARHPRVELELVVDRGGGLRARLEAGELDLVMLRRQPDDASGDVIATEELIWAAAQPHLVAPDRPVPLVLFSAPSISRALALDALHRAGRAWRIICTSSSLNGMHAAALAGLGVVVQTRSMLPPRLHEVDGLPPPGHIAYVVMLAQRAAASRRALARAVMADQHGLAPAAGPD